MPESPQEASLVTGASVLLSSWGTVPAVRMGAALVAAACLCWAIDNCVTSTIDRLAPATIIVAKGVIAESVNLVVGLATSPTPSLPDTAFAMGIGAVGYGLSLTLWVTGARDLGAARGQIIFSAAPFIGVLLARTVFGDAVTAAEVVALILLFGGMSLVVRSDHAHGHEHQPVTHAHEHRHDAHHRDHRHPPDTPERHSHSHRHTLLAHATSWPEGATLDRAHALGSDAGPSCVGRTSVLAAPGTART